MIYTTIENIAVEKEIKMKIEKKTIALCICALTIGIITILPIAYLTPRTSNHTSSISDVNILYANVLPFGGGGRADIASGDRISIIANFTTTPKATELGDIDAKIEVFNFHVYSDQTSIANITFSYTNARQIYNNTDEEGPYIRRGLTSAIWSQSGDRWGFADGTTFDVKDVIGPIDGTGSVSFFMWDTPAGSTETIHSIGQGYAFLSEANGERSAQALFNLRNAQTLYIDVTRALIVTYRHQADSNSAVSSLTTTFGSDKVLTHVKLVKTEYGFVSGEVPDFMQQGNSWQGILPPTSLTMQASKQAGLSIFGIRKPVG